MREKIPVKLILTFLVFCVIAAGPIMDIWASAKSTKQTCPEIKCNIEHVNNFPWRVYSSDSAKNRTQHNH